MRYIDRLILPFLLIALTGCGTFRHREPAWVVNPKSVYSDDKYLVSVGEGDSRSAAESAAEANLARIFEARIKADERLLDTVKETGKEFSRTTDYSTDVNILSSQTLFNIQHAEAWQDKNARYHAVAYLNRRETARLYLDKINELTTRVQFLLDQASHAGDLLKKYALLRAASHASVENQLLLEQLKIIHPPTAAASSPPYSLNNLQKTLADTAKKIRVGIGIEGDYDGRIRSCLAELITRYGFVLGEPAVLDIAGRVTVDDTGQRTAGLVFVRYELSVQIEDSTETVLAAINEKGRESHFTLPEARTRAFRTLENAINAEGAHRLDAYFDSLVDQSR